MTEVSAASIRARSFSVADHEGTPFRRATAPEVVDHIKTYVPDVGPRRTDMGAFHSEGDIS